MQPSETPVVPPTAPLPGPVRQVGYVVRDIDAAIAGWVALGVGPWFVRRGQQQNALHRGEPVTVAVSIAFGNAGDMQFELIQQEGDTPSIYTEFLDAHGEGFNQLAWWADDYDAAIAAVEGTGWPVVWSGGGETEGSARYAYLEPGTGPAPILELMELTPATRGLGELVRRAAADWDGTDPVRTLGG